MGPHIDPGFSNSIEIIVFACVGLFLAYRLKKLEEALLIFAGRASRPLPSVAATTQVLSEPRIHVPSDLLAWNAASTEDEE